MSATVSPNTTRIPTLLLCAVLVSVLALVCQPLIPKKRLVITAPDTDYDLVSSTLPDHKPSARWVSDSHRQFSCLYPEGVDNPDYYCSWNRRFGSEQKGLDISKFHTINFNIRYSGGATKLKLFARNYNPAYSKEGDFNSTKYNTILIPVSELNKEISLSIHEFSVAEWWLLFYKIPRQLAMPELNNVVAMGVDFSYPMATGLHQVKVESIELVGDWVSQKTWYLAILCCWLLGIFVYQLYQLIQARKQRAEDSHIILTLNNDKKHLQEETSKFRRLSTVDPLTQTYNRFGIDQVVNSLIAAKEAADAPDGFPLFCLILIDIDYFKKVNDTYGHDAGDAVLQQVSQRIQDELRSMDYLGRWGGEEFLIILPHMQMPEAFELAETLRKKLAATPINLEQTQVQITASFGVGACWNGDYATAFKRVDEALYQAKHSGRNRTVIAQDDTEVSSEIDKAT